MDFGKSQVITNMPSIPQKDYDAGQQFDKQVGDLFKLANSSNFSSFKGQGSALDLRTIKDNPNLTPEQKYKLTEELLQTPSQKSITPTSVSLTELEPYMKSRDFEKLGYTPGADNYQSYIDNRSVGNTSWKIFNKFLTSTVVGGASAITPVGTGLGYLTGTDYGKQWSDKLAAWQEVKNEYNQIYYNDAENNASGMNPLKTPAKFFDNLIPSIGFTVGNIATSYFTMRLGGNAFMKGLGTFSKESEVFRTLQRTKLGMYRGMKDLDALAGNKGLLSGAQSTVDAISKSTKVLQGLKTGAGNVAKILPYSFYSAAGEGHIEASMAKHEYFHTWLEEYKQKTGGALPSAEEQAKRMALAEEVYDEVLKYNTIVLTLTNTLEIGALVKKMGLTGELLKRSGLGKVSKVFDTDDIVFRGFKEGWQKKTFKEMILPYTTVSVIDALGESFEEASQYAISKGVQDWGTQKFLDPNAVNLKKDWLEKMTGFETDSFKYIASMDNIDDEMKSNAYFGFLSGVAMSGGTKILNSVRNRNAPDVAQKRADLLNKNTEFLSLKFVEANENKVNNYTQNAKILEESIKNGDVFTLKNMEFADLYTWTANSIAAGGFDLRVEQLLDLKNLSKEDFESFFNLEFNDENKTNVNSYIDKVIKEGKEIAKDIEQFRNTDNIFTFHDKPEEELTKSEKEENENFELFENVKYEMAYSYSRLKNFNKRNSKILDGLENTIGGTKTLSNLKKILFSPNGISEYKSILQEEIKELKTDLKNLGTDTIFKEDFNKKQKEIKEKESILDSLSATKEDIDKWIEDSKEELTDNQKQNLLNLTKRGLDRSNLKTILKYEMAGLQKEGVEFKVGDNKVLTLDEMVSAIETPILDIYNINSSKGIVLDKFNKLQTIKGAKEFVREYKELQDRFEKGEIKQDTFNDEFRKTLKDAGYPEGTNAIGVNITYFADSSDTIEENAKQLDKLNSSHNLAINTITEVKFKPKKEEDKEEIGYETKFVFGELEIKLNAKTRDELENKIEEVTENLKSKKYKKEKSDDFIIKRIVKHSKNKEGKWIAIPYYQILNKQGTSAFGDENKKFTGKELFDFLKGINTLSNANIRKYEVIPFSKFGDLQKTMTSSIISRSRLSAVNTRLSIVESKRIQLESQLNTLKTSVVGNEMLNSSLKDILNTNYVTIYELEIKLQELLNQSKSIKNTQESLNSEYRASRGNKARWSNTIEGKRFKQAYQQVQEQIKFVQGQIIQNKENLDIFNKENEELFSFYNTLNELQLELNQLLSEKELLKVYGDKLVTNLQDLNKGITSDYIDVSTEIKELKTKVFSDLSSEEIKNLTDEFQLIGEKHEQLRVLKNQYQFLVDTHNENIKIHQKEIDRIQAIIDELEDTMQYTTEEDAVETFRYINNLKPSLVGLDTEINKIKSDLEILNQKISEIDTVINKSNSSILEDFIKLQSLQRMFGNVSRASVLKESLQVNKNINDFSNANYHGQRKSILQNGKEIILEFDPVDNENADKMKPNFIYQLTSQDITANISPEKVLEMTKEEMDNFPNIEFHRFLSQFSPMEIRELFEVLIVTPASIKESNPDLYTHLSNQFKDKTDMSETTDLFSVIIDKNTKRIVKQNGKFLTSSFYKADNKFKTNAEGLPLHVTEQAVLNDFIQFSEQYTKNIENKTKEEIDEYLKSKETLKEAIQFSKQRYEDEVDDMLKTINSGKYLISEIKDVTSGIFLWGKPKSVDKVMGITPSNINDFTIGVVVDKNGGALTYIDLQGNKQEVGQGLKAGTTAIVNIKTGEWIPLNHKEQDDKSLNDILGILTYVVNEHQKSGKSILDLGKTSIPYGKEDFQLFLDNNNKEIGIDKIPLFPTLYNPKKEGRTITLGQLSKTYSARWSVITSLMNFGKDNKNPKNSFFFDEFNKLHYYDFNTNSMKLISSADLGELLNSYQNGKVEELSEEQKLKLSGIVQHIKQKRKNISYQYVFSTRARTAKGSKFLFKLPQYNSKTQQIEFKTFNSYLEYVIGLGVSDSGLVQTKVEKVDDRTSFQKSIILETDLNNRLSTTEVGEISKDYLDISKVEAREEKEESSEPTIIESKPIPTINVEDLKLNENKNEVDIENEDTLYILKPDTFAIIAVKLPGNIEEINYQGKFISINTLKKNNRGKELAKSFESTVEKLKNTSDPFEKDIIRLHLKSLFYKTYKSLYNVDLQSAKTKSNFDIPNNSIIEIENLGTYKVVGEFNFFAGNTLVVRNEKNENVFFTKELLEQGIKENKVKVTKVITDAVIVGEQPTSTNQTEIDNLKAEIEKLEKDKQEELTTLKVGDSYDVISSTGSFDGTWTVTEITDKFYRLTDSKGGKLNMGKSRVEENLKKPDGISETKYRKSNRDDINNRYNNLIAQKQAELKALEKSINKTKQKETNVTEVKQGNKSKEDLWEELVDTGYDSHGSLEEYESFIKSFDIPGNVEEILLTDINNAKLEEKDSLKELTLNKILKENNIKKNC